MWTAFPSSDYYADSATPSARQPASGLTGPPPAARRARGASHVHHDPFDRVGSWLCPYSPSGGHSQHPTGHHARIKQPDVERAAIQQSGIVAVDDPGPPGFGSFEKSRGFYHHFAFALPFGLASTRAGVWQCRPAVTLSGRLTSSARSRALAVPSFSGPLHQPRAGIPAGTDEMFVVLHLLSHGTSWRRTDFLGFSYGFRPGRRAHDALDVLAVGIARKKVNWVLDADISDFFGSVDRSWLLKFLEHRIADRRVLRLIGKWLAAGVIENGIRSDTEEGTAQGASASPLLSNVYLHYVFDLWADQWRRRNAHGDVIIVRFADDCVPRTLKEDRCRRRYRRMRSCARDEGARPVVWWLFVVALQGVIANHREVRRSRAGVLSVAEKACCQRVRCGSRRRAKAIPPLKCRKRIGDVQNRGRVVAPGSAWREPVDWPGGCPAWMVARAWSGLWCGTREPVAPMGRPASGAVWACGRSSGARTPSSRSARGRVVMRGTGADLTVVVMTAL